MADSSPTPSSNSSTSSTSSTSRRRWTSGRALMAWLAIALLFLVAVTIGRDSEPSTADAPSTGDAPSAAGDAPSAAGDAPSAAGDAPSAAGDASESAVAEASSAEDGEGDSAAAVPADGSPESSGAADVGTASSPSSNEPGDESAPTPTTTAGATTPPATTVASPTATTTATAPPTTIVVTAPPTTIVVTAPPTTISVTAPPATTAPLSPLDTCTVLGTDDFGDIEIELTAASPATTVAHLEVGFELRDGEGELFLPDFVIVDYAGPGEVVRLEIQTFEPLPPGNDVGSVTCALGEIFVIDLFDDQLLPGPDDTCSVIGVDDIGDLQLDVTVQNPSLEAADVIFAYAVRDPQGTRVISDLGFADALGPGQISAQQLDTLRPPPSGLDPAGMTCDVVGLDLF